MPSIRHLVLTLCLLSTSGCYFYFSPPNNRAHPKIIPGAEIELSGKGTTQRVKCSDLDSRDICRTGVDTYRYKKYTATYGGQKLTEGELLALVSPRYKENWDRIESKRGTCKLSLVPTVLAGVALVAAGGISIYGSSKHGKIDEWPSDTKNALYATSAATVAFGLLSYPIGGFACVTAHRLGLKMGTKYHDEKELRVGDRDQHWTDERIEELDKLVRDFNAKAKGAAAPATDEPPPPEPAE